MKTAEVNAAQASEGYAVMQDETERLCHEQMRGLRRRLAFPTLTALARLLAVSADRHTDVNGFIGTCIGTITEEPAQTASSLCFVRAE